MTDGRRAISFYYHTNIYASRVDVTIKDNPISMNPPRYYAAVFLVSASILANEVLLIRLFSIVQWYHFAYMSISIAMLGFGAAGTCIFIVQESARRHLGKIFWAAALGLACSIAPAFSLAQCIPFNPLLLPWELRQIVYLLGYYLVLTLPFFFGSACIGVAFMSPWLRPGSLYCASLVGSGVGAIAAVGLMHILPPRWCLAPVTAVAALAAASTAHPLKRTALGRLSPLLAAAAAIAVCAPWRPLNISKYKSLSQTLQLPDSRLVEERYSPLGLVDVVESEAFHYAPGLSLNFPGIPPRQAGIFVDGEGAGAITLGGDDPSRGEHLDYVTSAAPYHILKRRPTDEGEPDGEDLRVLVLGAGGGEDVLGALFHQAGSVEAVEINPQIIALARSVSGGGGAYEDPRVQVTVAEARSFVRGAAGRYDIIQITLLDSLGAAASGIQSLSESYLYTIEAFRDYLDHLSPRGVLSVTRWLKHPARDNIKIFATAVEAVEASMGTGAAAARLALIRSWATGTVLVKQAPFSKSEIERLKGFCKTRQFDVAYYPGIEAAEVNLRNILARPWYFDSACSMLGPERDRFYRDYAFDVRPATDDRPYFFHFFRRKTLGRIMRSVGREWVPFIEGGSLVLGATLVQAALASLAFILLPVYIRAGRPRGGWVGGGAVAVFFTAIGFGFMFAEMAFIQKLSLFLGHPVVAAAVTLASVLVASGLGSLCSGRSIGGREMSLPVAAAALVVLIPLFRVAVGPVTEACLAYPVALRALIAAGLVGLPSFFMGMPFPAAMERLRESRPPFVPWAWGVNGFASVVGAALATTIALSRGGGAVLLAASAMYALALMGWCGRPFRKGNPNVESRVGKGWWS